MGKPKDPNYWRKYRAAHPEYRERERERLQGRERTPEQRRLERERAGERAKAVARAAEKLRERQRRWSAKNREWWREHHRLYYERHREERIRDATERNVLVRAKKRLEQARAIALRVLSPDHRDWLHDPLFEDALGVAVVALIEAPVSQRTEKKEQAALEAVKAFVREERRHRWYATYDVYDLEAISPLGVEEVPLDQDPVAL